MRHDTGLRAGGRFNARNVIKAFRSFLSFERKAEAKTWLFRIAHNVTIDDLRKNKPPRMIESFLLNKKDTKPLPEDTFEMKEHVRHIYKALRKLKSSYREVIVLRKVKAFSITVFQRTASFWRKYADSLCSSSGKNKLKRSGAKL